MKDIEKKLLSEFMKNSRRSEWELAKAIGSSQPAVTRTRVKLEEEGDRSDIFQNWSRSIMFLC